MPRLRDVLDLSRHKRTPWHKRRRKRRLRVEPLEARVVLDGMPVISELMAVNDFTIEDEDGDDSDWIEIHNAGDAAIDLAGWHLTDDPNDLTRWTLPSVALGVNEQLLVFASGKDRAVAGSELHTNFLLAGDGEYLALVAPDGVTIGSEFNDYPEQVPDMSYGLAVQADTTTVLDAGAAATAIVPGDDLLELTWTEPTFDDTAWTAGTTGVGFDTDDDYDPLIGLDLEAQMAGVNSSAFIRVPFTVADPTAVDLLNLDMQYDDGFVAYLNGQEVARRNASQFGAAPLLAHWSFDEAGGAAVADSSSGENHGTLVGAGGSLAAAGVFNAAGDVSTGGLALSNGADYVSVPSLDLRTRSLTFAAWINPTAIDSGDEIFGDWSSPWQFRMFLNDNGSLSFTARRDGPGVNDGDLLNLTTPAGSIATGTYQHVALTWDRITRTARLWIDGQSQAAQSVGPQNVDWNESFHADYQIGWKKDSGAGVTMYEGLIDEVWVLDEALAGEQIQYLIDNNAYLPGDSRTVVLDLADVVGGGDGSLPGTGTVTGINAVTGAVGQAIAGGNHEHVPGQEGTYVAVAQAGFEWIDGVFLPDGTIGPQTIDGAGHTFDFAGVADNSPAYNVIANGPAGNDPSGVEFQPDFTGNAAAHSILGMHAQQGVTFDLTAIAADYDDLVPRRFTAFAGQARAEGSTHYFVLIDGQVVASGSFAGIGHDALDVSVPAAAEYLTLITTNSNVNVNSADHSYFGDPMLILDEPAAMGAIDLADIVGGGDGLGNGSASGIDATTGNVDQGGGGGNYFPTAAGDFYPVEEYAFVDGVFTPDGTIGPQTIDSDGHTYDFVGFGDNKSSYGHFFNGVGAITDPSGQSGNPNYADPEHSLLTAHAQKGITFDLDAIRAAHPDIQPNVFRTTVGLSSVGSVHYFVLIDGVLVEDGAFSGAAAHTGLRVPIDVDDAKLTLVMSNQDNSNSSDHGYFGDPWLVHAEMDLADLVGGGGGFGDGAASGIDAASGNVGLAGENFDHTPTAPGDFYSVTYAMIDGVFVPDGTIGAQQISSTGLTFDFAGQADASPSWGTFFNGVGPIDDPSSVAGLPDFTAADHSIIAAHAQKGITFDLDAVRTATGQEPLRLTTIAGDSRPKAGGSVSYYVLIDGVVAASGLNLNDNEDTVDVSIAPTDRFLTLVMTNAAIDVNSADHGYFGDPTLHFSIDEGGGEEEDPQGRWNAAALSDRPDALATIPESIDISGYRDLLLPGADANVLAIHAMNVAADDADLLIVPQLQTGTLTLLGDTERYFTIPTPGEPNAGGLENPPPRIWDVDHSPNQPDTTEAVVVEAEVTDPDGLTAVELSYQIVAPGHYIPAELPLSIPELLANPLAPRQPNPEFEDPANWTVVTMVDDGTGVDRWAGDGVYSAVIAPQINRTLVRYRVTATDTTGSSIRAPLPNDPSLNFAYYVYDGVPDYVAADASVHPDGAGHVHDSETLESLPVYTIITDADDMYEVMGYDSADRIPKSNVEARSNFNWEGAFVYDGVVYDHIHYRLRQANDRYGGTGKRGMRFRFNKGNYLQAHDIWGDPYPTEWRTLNVSKMSDNKRVGNFGMVENMNLLMWNMADVPSPYSHWFHFRVVDGEEEAPAGANGQYYGDFWGMALAVEDYDSRFLDAHDLPDGNLYKLKDQVFDGNDLKRHQGTFSVRDDSDFQNIRANLRPERDASWLTEHVDYDAWYRYHTVVEAVRHYDYRPSDTHSKNRAWFFEPNAGSTFGQVWTLPHDHDSSWGPNFNEGIDYSKQAIFGYTDGTGAKPEFKQEYRNTIREFRDLFWQQDVLHPLIDRLAAVIEGFVLADRDRWTGAPADAGYEDYGSLEAKVQDMKNFAFVGWSGSTGPTVGAGGRAAYLDSLADAEGDATSIPDTPTVTSLAPAGFPVDALTFQTTPYSDPQGAGTFAAIQWRIAEVEDPAAPAYDPDAPPLLEYNAAWQSDEITTFADQVTIPTDQVRIGHAYRVRARMKDDTGRWGHWSAPVQFVVGPTENTQALMASLRVTELNYHPHDPTSAELAVIPTLTDNDFEFIELTNTGASPLDLTEVVVSDGVSFAFELGAVATLAPGERVLVVRNETALATRYDTAGVLVAGTYDGKLSNGGERLRLEGLGGAVVQEFSYNDNWYEQTDGGGFTLLIADPAGELDRWDEKDGWLPSHRAGGTPGGGPDAELVLPETIVVNELRANSTGVPGDWIELINLGATSVDVGGWLLSNSPTEPAMYQIAAPTVLASGATLVLTEDDHFGAGSVDPGMIVPLSLSAHGDTVFVTAAEPVTAELLGYRSEQSFGASQADVPLGRYVKSTGGKDFVALSAPTPDGPNAAPLVGPLVINEIMYHPPDGGQEFIELLNIGGAAVPLDDGQGNPWRLRGAINYPFPLGASIPAGEFALLIQGVDLGDPVAEAAAFRATHGVPAGVPIFVYTDLEHGSLSNDSEKLFLEQPGDPNAGLPLLPYILIDAVKYDDGNNDPQGWPAQADGAGSALGRIDAALYGNDVINWAATTVGGTPGAANAYLDSTPPTLPTGLTATIAGAAQVDLSWLPSTDPESGVDHYNIYRDDTLLGSSAAVSWQDNSPLTDGTIRYEVAAVNGDGVESARSLAAEVTVGVLQLQNGVLPDAASAGIDDTYIAAGTPDDVLGDLTILKNDGSPQERSLLRWDVSSIPVDSTVLGASLEVVIFNQSAGTYPIYAVLRDWDAAQTTWNHRLTGLVWETAGAFGATDVGTVELGVFPAAISGRQTIELNAAGVALVQQWIDGTATNFGLLIGNPANGDSMQFYSSDYDILPESRPKIAVTYVQPTPDAEVVGRHLFYNDSAFDGNDPDASADDDNAIAVDKVALRPEQPAGPEHISNFAGGINGVMIDVAHLAHADLITTDDLRLRVGNDNDPALWDDAPLPSVSVHPDAGFELADRITLVWPAGSISGQWLEVTVLAGDHTGLLADDVFYFGSAIGETGNDSTNALVTAADVIAIRDNPRGAVNRAGVDNPFDINRDRLVNATDALLARNHATGPFTALRRIVPLPPSPPPAEAEGEQPRWAAPVDVAARVDARRVSVESSPMAAGRVVERPSRDWQYPAVVAERGALPRWRTGLPSADRARGGRVTPLSSAELDHALAELLSAELP